MDVGGSREQVRVNDFGKGHAVGKSKVDIAKFYLMIAHLFSFQGSVASESPASDDVHLFVGEALLRLHLVFELSEERGDDVVEEENDFVLVAEDAFSFFLDDVYVWASIHLSRSRLILVKVFFLRSKSA